MHPRAVSLIQQLELQPHPEGGYYREVFRSAWQVRPDDRRTARNALTSIYYLLPDGGFSRWHRVHSDEVWHFYEGEPLELFWLDEADTKWVRDVLGPVGDGVAPVRCVPAGRWQAARSTGSYTLVGCSVGPGFDFADFELLADAPRDADYVTRQFPHARELL